MVIGQFHLTVLFLLYFLSLRKHTGGYHSNSFVRCYIGTVVTCLALICVNKILIKHIFVLVFLLLVSIGIIGIIGTVNHPNMHMKKKELAGSKRAARLSVLAEGISIFLLYLMDVSITCIGAMSVAVILCAILLCLAKIIKQEVVESEENQQTGIEDR